MSHMKISMKVSSLPDVVSAQLKTWPLGPITHHKRDAKSPLLSLAESADGELRLYLEFAVNDLVPSASPIATGTSVFAMGRGGVELVCIELIRAGLSGVGSEYWGVDHVEIEHVSLPFLIEMGASKKTVQDLAKEMSSYGRLVGAKVSYSPSNRRTTFSIDELWDGAGAESNERQELKGVVVTMHAVPQNQFMRLDVHLPRTYLIRHSLSALSVWRDAYAHGLYKHIFRNTVRRMFALDSRHDHSEPPEAVFQLLGIEEAAILRDYIAGKRPLVSPRWQPGLTEAKRRKKLNALAETIKRGTGYNILAPWTDFKSTIPELLTSKLQYPTDPDSTKLQAMCKVEQPGAWRQQPLLRAKPSPRETLVCKSHWTAQLGALCRVRRELAKRSQ